MVMGNGDGAEPGGYPCTVSGSVPCPGLVAFPTVTVWLLFPL